MAIIKRMLWRPNNYRRGLEIKCFHYIKDSTLLNSIRNRAYYLSFPVEIAPVGKKNLVFITLTPNIKVMVGRKKMVGIWCQRTVGAHKETFLIEAPSDGIIDERVNEKKERIRDALDKALQYVGRHLGVSVIGNKFYWVRHEDWVKGEEFIDKIPKDLIIHDTVFKKVYQDGIEFIGGKGVEPTVRFKNYIKNRALEDFSPVIAGALNTLAGNVQVFNAEFFPVFSEFARDVKVHNEVLKKMEKSFNKFNRLLSSRQKKLSEFGA